MRKHEEQLALEISAEHHQETIRYGRVIVETTENIEKLLTALSYVETLEEQMRNIMERLDDLRNN